MKDKGLSMDAKNVKLVYSDNGLIILRGAVDSDNEKIRVGELAKGTQVSAAYKTN